MGGEVANKLFTEDDRARALALVGPQDFLRAVLAFQRTEGIAPHPAIADRILQAEEKEHSKRARASTPRSGNNWKVSAGVAK